MKKYTFSNRENSYTLLSVSNKDDVTVARKEFNTPGNYIIWNFKNLQWDNVSVSSDGLFTRALKYGTNYIYSFSIDGGKTWIFTENIKTESPLDFKEISPLNKIAYNNCFVSYFFDSEKKELKIYTNKTEYEKYKKEVKFENLDNNDLKLFFYPLQNEFFLSFKQNEKRKILKSKDGFNWEEINYLYPLTFNNPEKYREYEENLEFYESKNSAVVKKITNDGILFILNDSIITIYDFFEYGKEKKFSDIFFDSINLKNKNNENKYFLNCEFDEISGNFQTKKNIKINDLNSKCIYFDIDMDYNNENTEFDLNKNLFKETYTNEYELYTKTFSFKKKPFFRIESNYENINFVNSEGNILESISINKYLSDEKRDIFAYDILINDYTKKDNIVINKDKYFEFELKDVATPTPWNGEIATSFAGGNGSEKNPYLISNGEELALLSAIINSDDGEEGTTYLTTNYVIATCRKSFFKLTKDISLNSDLFYTIWETNPPLRRFIPIGRISAEFKGNFDGNNHIIYGLYSSNTENENYKGLFGSVSDGKISNLILRNCFVKGSRHIGILAGFSNTSIIENCEIKESILGGNIFVGSLIGKIGENIEIKNCSNNNVNVKTEKTIDENTPKNIGGLIGGTSEDVFENNLVSIENCENLAEITVLHPGSVNIGGIIGVGDCGFSIRNCYNRGNISLDVSTLASSFFIGGIVGNVSNLNKMAEISNCFNYGNINWNNRALTYTNEFAKDIGGIVGGKYKSQYEYDPLNNINLTKDLKILSCQNYGNIFGVSNIGGIIGRDDLRDNFYHRVEIENCYNSGEILSLGENVGGIAGYVSKIYNCSNIGEVIGYSHVGGIAGVIREKIYNCFNKGIINAEKTGETAGGIAGQNMTQTAKYFYNISSNFIGSIIENNYNTEEETSKNFFNTSIVEEINEKIKNDQEIKPIRYWIIEDNILSFEEYKEYSSDYPTNFSLLGSGTRGNPYLIYTLKDLKKFFDSLNFSSEIISYSRLQNDLVLNDKLFEFNEPTGFVIVKNKKEIVESTIGTDIKGTSFFEIITEENYSSPNLWTSWKNTTINKGIYLDGNNFKIKNIIISPFEEKNYYFLTLKNADGNIIINEEEGTQFFFPSEENLIYSKAGSLYTAIPTTTEIYFNSENNNFYKETSFQNRLYLKIENAGNSGLMGELPLSSSLLNLTLENSVILSKDGENGSFLGGFCAIMKESSLIDNCHTKNTFMVHSSKEDFSGTINKNSSVGGICGYADNSAKIKNCSSDGIIYGRANIGGICGETYLKSLIENSSNTASLKILLRDDEIRGSEDLYNKSKNIGANVGGICGYLDKSIINKCSNYSLDIDTSGNINNFIEGSSNIGGIAGYSIGSSSDSSEVKNSFNSGVISGNFNFGGLVGFNGNNSRILNSFNQGTIKSEGIDCLQAGGITGRNAGKIENVYNSGDFFEASNEEIRIKGEIIGYNISSDVSYCFGKNSLNNLWQTDVSIPEGLFARFSLNTGDFSNSAIIIIEEKQYKNLSRALNAWVNWKSEDFFSWDNFSEPLFSYEKIEEIKNKIWLKVS